MRARLGGQRLAGGRAGGERALREGDLQRLARGKNAREGEICGVQPGEDPSGETRAPSALGGGKVTRGTHRCVPGSICLGGWARSSAFDNFFFILFFTCHGLSGGQTPARRVWRALSEGGEQPPAPSLRGSPALQAALGEGAEGLRGARGGQGPEGAPRAAGAAPG